MSKYQADKLELHRISDNEHNPIHAHFAEVTHLTLSGMDPKINPDKPPRNFRDAMTALDKRAWARRQLTIRNILDPSNAKYLKWSDQNLVCVFMTH
jgi:hypothetical protein